MRTLDAEGIRSARLAAGWSITEASRELKRTSEEPLPDVDSLVRSWKRWEKGTYPSRLYRPLLVRLLGLVEQQRVVPGVGGVDLSGDWWAAWQSSRDRREMRLWDNEILMGWYAADDGSVRSKGTVYFVLHPQGQRMMGRWVGLSWDGDAVTGLGVMARTEQAARQVLGREMEDE